MPESRPTPTPTHGRTALLGLVVCLVALLPWWRNHDFLRDFYDYGLFIDANAQLAQGLRPYADFTTPAQTGAFLLNYVAEAAGGGTYVGMTWGAAALIVAMGLAFTFILVRRFGLGMAALLALAVAVGSASQHTILFYNPVGVAALALVIWSFAVAPLLRRESWGWHVLAAIGLLLGGVNKINFHLLALAMAIGWVIHAWVAEKASGTRVCWTLAFLAGFGLVVPIALEIAWTGAGWSAWFYNVVQLPLGARGGRISYLFSPRLYLTTVHGYYGTLRVPQVGLIGVLMPLVAIIAAWREASATGRARRPWLLVPAGVLAALASSALLLTNNEIAYVTFAAALVIAIGLWLGFGLTPRGGWFVVGVVLPAVLLAAAGWESAWRGQRSQFGHEPDARDAYRPGEEAGPEFGYLRGLRLPPRLVGSLAEFAEWRRHLPAGDAHRIYYGPGVEWLEHIWPAPKVKGLPLLAAAFEGERENDLFKRAVIDNDKFQYLLVLEAWDHWSEAVQKRLDETTLEEPLGPILEVYRKLPAGTLAARPLEFRYGPFGGNVDSLRVLSRLPLRRLSDERSYLGLDRGEGKIEVDTPCQRMVAEYVLARANPGSRGALPAHLSVHVRMGDGLLPRREIDAVLPDGVNELVVPLEPVDGSGLPLTFSVAIPEASAGKIVAGWRAFQLLDSSDREDVPPTLRSSKTGLRRASPEERAALLPPALRDAPVFLRGTGLQDGTIVMPNGSEAWVRLSGLYTSIKISARLQVSDGEATPPVQVIYYKGGRLEPFTVVKGPQAGAVHCSAWSPENGGWIGLLANPQAGSPASVVKIEAAVHP